MTDSDERRISGELVRDFLEGLRAHADLDKHPLAAMLSAWPDFQANSSETGPQVRPGEGITRALRAIWRQGFMPPVLNLDHRKGWNFFLLLEVMYFYPHARRLRFPATLKEAARYLCDETHLALIIADGNESEAGKLLRDNRPFWAGFIPAAMTPAEQTLHSRRNAAVSKLAQVLNQRPATARAVSRPIQAIGPTESDLADREPPRTVAHQTAWSAPGADSTTQGPDPAPSVLAVSRLEEIWGARSANPSPRLGALGPVAPTPGQEVLDKVITMRASLTPAHLDELAVWLDDLGFPKTFGVTRAVWRGRWWWDEELWQRQLVEAFRLPSDDRQQIQCAAALRQSSLSVSLVDPYGARWPWQTGTSSALERVADVARWQAPVTLAHVLAKAILQRPDHRMRLASLGSEYARLAAQWFPPNYLEPADTR